MRVHESTGIVSVSRARDDGDRSVIAIVLVKRFEARCQCNGTCLLGESLKGKFICRGEARYEVLYSDRVEALHKREDPSVVNLFAQGMRLPNVTVTLACTGSHE